MKKTRCTAVVLSGGRGRRMGTTLAKQYLMIQDRPILWYSLDVFERSEVIDDVILVTGKGQIPYCRQEIIEKYGFQKIRAVVEGGVERYHSVWEGLRVLEQAGWKDGYIFIHDGARPFISEAILERAYEEVVRSRACVVGMPVKDTIKLAGQDGCAVQTPDRNFVWQIQTPQVFETALIIEAYKKLTKEKERWQAEGMSITDDAMVVENFMFLPVKLVQGSYQNIKITTPEDLVIAEAFLA